MYMCIFYTCVYVFMHVHVNASENLISVLLSSSESLQLKYTYLFCVSYSSPSRLNLLSEGIYTFYQIASHVGTPFDTVSTQQNADCGQKHVWLFKHIIYLSF